MQKSIGIKSVKKIDNISKRYDLQTQKNNNFFANNVLVHNSLIVAYYYDGAWQVATTGSADASGEVFGFGFTFAELFQRTFSTQRVAWAVETGFADELGRDDVVLVDGKAEKTLPNPFTDTDLCYLFELMTPYNRVVVPHKTSKVVLLGARNRVTGDYVDVTIEGVPNVREFPLNSFEGIISSFEAINGLDQEGYVVVDGAGNRVKVKHPQYVALHHLKDNMGPKWLAKVVVSGEVPELLVAFPEYEEELNKVKDKYEALVAEAEATYEQHCTLMEQKDFAMAVKDKSYSAILFSLRSGKVDTVRHWFADEKHFPSVLRLLGIKES